jgi:hypothetical protein
MESQIKFFSARRKFCPHDIGYLSQNRSNPTPYLHPFVSKPNSTASIFQVLGFSGLVFQGMVLWDLTGRIDGNFIVRTSSSN